MNRPLISPRKSLVEIILMQGDCSIKAQYGTWRALDQNGEAIFTELKSACDLIQRGTDYVFIRRDMMATNRARAIGYLRLSYLNLAFTHGSVES